MHYQHEKCKETHPPNSGGRCVCVWGGYRGTEVSDSADRPMSVRIVVCLLGQRVNDGRVDWCLRGQFCLLFRDYNNV